jgi:DNA-binding beta-propeller fold protein YncE
MLRSLSSPRALQPALALICTLVCVLLAGLALAQPNIVDTHWELVRTIEATGVMSATISPYDGQIYYGKRGSGDDGLFRMDGFGFAQKIADGSNVATVMVEPDSGHVYFSEDYGGIIYRVDFGTTGRTTWVSGFHSGDDDPTGMDIALPGHSSGVLNPGEALVIDRGYNGRDAVYRWSPYSPENEYEVFPDEGTLNDAAGVAIGQDRVYLSDSANGNIHVLNPDSTLTTLVLSEPLPSASAIDVDPNTGHLYVIDRDNGRLVNIDPDTGTVAEILTGLSTAAPHWGGVEVHPSGRRLLVTDHGNDAIYLLALCDAEGYPELDCDGNGVDDLCDVALYGADDCNVNSLPDQCEMAENDCNNDGRLDDCPVCPPVQAVFIMDTSSSMDNEAATLCNSMNLIIDYLEAADIAVQPALFGICDTPGGGYSCLEAAITDSLGTAVPGFPPENLAVLGDCPGGSQVCSEDWGRATAVVAGMFPWLPEDQSIRLIIPLSDEGPWCGDGITDDDYESIAHAITLAQDNQVIVSPVTASGSSGTVVALAQEIATATGGQQFSSSDVETEIAAGIVGIVSQACASFTDCDGNGTLDECDIAGHPGWDFNNDGILDRCQQGQGISATDLRSAIEPRLHPSVPNPFNPRTTIFYDLPRAMTVTLRVYDVSGRLVRDLVVDEALEEGRHEAVWLGRDDSGRPMASGTYFFRLETDGLTTTRPVVLLK